MVGKVEVLDAQDPSYLLFHWLHEKSCSLVRHFTQLAKEARQKVVDLRPEWGDAHCKFAEILWLGKPSVQKVFWRGGGTITAPDPHLDDPAIQQVINELQQAWTYGTEECLDGNIYWHLKKVFPEIELTLPVAATATLALPTETSIPLTTNTASPTISSTFALAPTILPTPNPTKAPSFDKDNVLPIVALSLIFVGGAALNLSKSRLKDV